MNTKITIKQQLTAWIAGLKEYAKQDVIDQIFWFVPTMVKPFSIVAGWNKMFPDKDFSDIFCCSKSQPEYVMCIKVAVNKNNCTDFMALPIPMANIDELDDTCIPLEWDDSAEAAAEFFLMEWERIMKEHGEEI